MAAPRFTELGLSRRLKTSQLVVFDRVVETGSILRAATDLQMTQPAATKVIQELESALGGALFVRSNRGVTPTELGILVARRAKSLLAELRHMSDELDRFHGASAGHILVGTLIAASAHLLPAAIALLKQRAPGVLVTVSEAPTVRLFPALATGELDLVIGRLPEVDLPIASAFPLQHHPLFEESLCFVVGQRHREAFSGAGSLRELHDAAWIWPNADSPVRHAAERLFRASGLAVPANLVESLSMLTNIGLLIETPCVAMMPLGAARQFVASGLLHILDLPERVAFGTIGYSVRADKQATPACRAFIDCLHEVAAPV